MTKTLLIYQKVAPLNKKRHANWGVRSLKNYAFARDVNSAPLTAIEFPAASMEFSIVFAKSDDGVVPIAVMGVRSRENLYVDGEGQWQARYIPAFIRRYPFVFSTADEGETLTLCLDEDYEGCSPEGDGEKLFTEAGESTGYLNKVVEFLKEYQNHFRRTQIFCKKLETLDLLEPMGAQFKTPDGQAGSLNGFFIVSRDKLKKLTGEQLLDLAKTDELELIYLHLNSMQNLRETIRRLGETKMAANG